MYYESQHDLDALIQGSSKKKTQVVSLGKSPSIMEYALALTASANSQVAPARHAPRSSIRAVVIRENNARVGQDKSVAHFGILRAVENFLSVATQNNASTPHIDLLPLGHPLLPYDGAITASAHIAERASWEAGTLDASPQTKALVASVMSDDPASMEYKFAVARLKVSAPDVLTRIL
jgi:hypothetical protein